VLTLALHTLAIAEYGLGRVEVAGEDHLRRAVALCESTGDVDNLEHLLVTMASIELGRTDTERTVALLGAAEAMRRQAGATVLPSTQTNQRSPTSETERSSACRTASGSTPSPPA
jgi:hypothetical protein